MVDPLRLFIVISPLSLRKNTTLSPVFILSARRISIGMVICPLIDIFAKFILIPPYVVAPQMKHPPVLAKTYSRIPNQSGTILLLFFVFFILLRHLNIGNEARVLWAQCEKVVTQRTGGAQGIADEAMHP